MCASLGSPAPGSSPEFGILHGFYPCDFVRKEIFDDAGCAVLAEESYQQAGECDPASNTRVLCQNFNFDTNEPNNNSTNNSDNTTDDKNDKSSRGFGTSSIIATALFGLCMLLGAVAAFCIFKSKPKRLAGGGGRGFASGGQDCNENAVELMSLEDRQADPAQQHTTFGFPQGGYTADEPAVNAQGDDDEPAAPPML